MKHLFFSLILSSAAYAMDFSWNNPNTSNWNGSSNWTPNGVPNGATDTATFAIVFNQFQSPGVTGLFEVQSVTFDKNISALQEFSSALLQVNTSINVNATATNTISMSVPFEFISGPTGKVTITNSSSHNLQFEGVLSGSAPVEVVGPGPIEFSNFPVQSNTFSGTLTIDSTATLNSLTKSLSTNTVINDGVLALSATNPNPYAGTISGSGVVKATSTQVVLSGVNSYTGGSIINENSQLNVSADHNLGDLSAPVTINPNGVLRTNGSFTINSNRTITINAMQASDSAAISALGTLTIDGKIVGAGGFGILNSIGGFGTIILTNSLNSQGGNAILDNETLQVDSDGALGLTTQPISGEPTIVSIDDNCTLHTTATFPSNRTLQTPGKATIDVDGGTALTLTGVLQDQGTPGKFVKEGAGTLILTGANTYSKGTTVTGGVLQGTTTGIQGNVLNNASVVFDQTTTGTYAGVMSGTGSLTKSNTGTVILSGVNTYFGGTSVTQGTLQVGADSNLGNAAGDVTLSSLGALKTTGTFTSNRTFHTPDTGVLNVNGGTTLTLGGVLQDDGTPGEFVKEGMGTLILTGTNTYTGGTSITDGTLQVSTDDNLGNASGNVSLSNSGALKTTTTFISNRTFQTPDTGVLNVNGGTTLTLGGVLQDDGTPGEFVKEGMGTLILTGTNTYSGGTSVTDGTLQISADNNLGNASGNVSLSNSGVLNTTTTFTSNRTFQSPDTGVLNVNGGTNLTLGGVLQDNGTPGEFVKEGAGTLILTGANTYTGGTTVNTGVLQGTTTGIQGNVTNKASVVFDQTTTGTYAGVISGSGSLTKSNTGTVILSGANTYSGGTTVDAGVLQGTTTGIQGNVTNDASVVFDQTTTGTYAGVMSGTGSLTKSNTGTVILTGTNTYSGGTSVTDGTLQVGADSKLGNASGNVSLSNSGILNTTTTFTSNRTFQSPDTGSLNVNGGTNLTLGGVLQDNGTPGEFVKEGAGTLILTGANTYSGGTTVNAGVLQGTTSGIQGNVTNDASVVFDQTPTGTFAGAMSGTGSLTKSNSGTVILSGSNTYSGGTTVDAGVLQGTTTSLQGNIINDASVVFDQTSTGTYSDVMSGTGSLTKSNTGTLILSSANTYTGGTSITDGTLQVSTDDNLGNASGNVSLSNSGVLNTTTTFTSNRTFQSPDTGVLNVNGGTNLTLGGVLQDNGTPGEFVKEGAGTLILTGANTYSGGTTVNAGVFQGTTTGIQGDVTNNTSVVFDQTITGTYSGVLSGPGSLTKSNTGTVILTGASSYSGGTTVTGGTLQVGADSKLGNASGDVTLSSSGALKTTATFTSNRIFQSPDTGVINVDGGTTLTLAGVLQDNGTAGEFVKDGMGILVLSGVNTYSGGTSISDGTLQVSTDDNLGNASGNVSLSNSGILNTTTTFTSNRTFQSPDTGALNVNGGTTLTLGGVLQDDGTPGEFVKEGAGILLLTGANTYSAGTIVNTGVLQGTTTGIQGDVTNDAYVVFDQTTTGTYAGVMSGTGSLTKSNTGTVILTGVNSYSGGTSVIGGTLQISADHNLGNASGAVRLTNSGVLNTTATFSSNRTFQTPNAGVFNVDGGTTLSLTGVLQDDGTLGEFVKNGAGTLILTGANTYSDGTTVSAGVLQGTTTGIQGAVTNNTSVVFDQTLTGTYAGVMSGTGSLTKSNTGTVILTGTNTYSGGTTVTGGTLQVGADDNLGNAVGDVTLANSGILKTTASFTSNRLLQTPNSGVLNVDGGTSLTLAGVLQDQGTPGKFTKNGEGTLILSGSNTYSNGTTVSQGTLQISADDNLGNAAGIVTLANSSILNTTAMFSSNRTFQTPDTGVFDVDGGTALTLTGVLQDQGAPGKFFKEGTGTLILTGANTYSNGTTVTGGVLQGTTTGIQGDVLNSASVVFDQTSNGTYSGVISGTGSLTKANTGTVILTGANSYSGGTMVNDGVLQGNTTSLQGVITNDATLVFNERGVKPFKGSLEGTGVLNKQNRGIVLLNGAHPFTGTTNINAGGIRLNGSVAGPVNVGMLGALGGNAQVGDLTNAGLVFPGTSIGIVTVNGNYMQTNAGNLAIEIRASGASDQLNATGTATLDGRLIVAALPGLYDGSETYQILSAALGVGGTFAQEIAIGNVIYQLTYLPNSVVLSNQYVGPVLPISPSNLKGNPKKVAEYLFCAGLVPTNPDLLGVMNALLSLPPDEFIAALDRLHPAQFGALPLVVLQNSHTMANTMVSTTVNMHDCQTCQGSSCPPQAGQTLVWVTPIGQWQSQKATDDQLGFNTQTYGGSVGSSHLFSSWINVALGGGYSHTALDWKHNAGDGHWNSIYLGPSVGLIGGNWFVNFLAQGAVNFFSMDRKISFPGIKRTAHNSHHSYDILGRFDGGYQFVIQQHSPIFFVPTFRLGYLNIFEESYTESGADSINLAVDSKYSAFLQPEVLMRIRKEIHTGNLCIVPKFELGWIGNIPLSSGNYTSSFYKQDLCSSDFSVSSFHDTTNQFVFGMGLTIIRIGNFQFDMGYQARVFDKVYINSAQLSFEKAF